MKSETGLFSIYEGEERVELMFSLVWFLLSQTAFIILQINNTIQVHKINLDLQNPLADLL